MILRQNLASHNVDDGLGLAAVETGLSARVAHASAWIAVLQVVVRMASLVRLAIVARLLGPHEFGLVAIALVAMSSVQAFSSPGITVALLQPGRHDRPLLDTAWTLLVLRGAVVAAIVFLAAPLVGLLFHAPEVVPIMRVIAMGPLLDGLANIGMIEFRRSFTVGRYLIIQACGPIADMLVSVALGLWLQNAWALVGGWLALWSVRLAASYAAHPYRPRWRIDGRRAWRLLGYGRWVSASTALAWILSEGVNGIVGRVGGIEALGFFRTARPIGMLPTTELAGLVSWVTLAAYARLQDDADRARQALLRVLGTTAVLMVPAALGVAAFGAPLVRLLLGERWAPVAPLVQVFAVMGLFRAITAIEMAALQGLGRPSLATRAPLVELVALVAVGPWLLLHLGTLGMALATAAAAFAGAVAATSAVRHLAGVTFHDVIARVGWPLAACVPALAIAAALGDRLANGPLLAAALIALPLFYVAIVVTLERLRLVPEGFHSLLAMTLTFCQNAASRAPHTGPTHRGA